MMIKAWMCTALMILLLVLVPSYAGAARIKAISACDGSMVLMDDGTVYAWGNNASHPAPEKVQGLTNITAISAYICNYMALRDDGTVWVWTWIDKDSPPRLVQVPISNVKAISAPTMLRNDGTVWEIVPPLKDPAFAVDVYNASASATVTVRQVPGLDNVKYLGRNMFIWQKVAVKDDGSVWMWGGDASPVRIDISNVKEVASSGTAVLALKNDGTVWAWGSNWGGLFGNGMDPYNVDATMIPPVQVTLTPAQVKVISHVTSISIQDANAMALKDDGSVWVWGSDQFNALGVYAVGDYYIPQKLGSLNNVIAISMGRGHGMALKNDGTLWAWGANFQGQLGDGTVTPPLEHGGGKDKPVKVLIDTSGSTSISPSVVPSANPSFGDNSSIVIPSTGNKSEPATNGLSLGDGPGFTILAFIALILASVISLALKKK